MDRAQCIPSGDAYPRIAPVCPSQAARTTYGSRVCPIRRRVPPMGSRSISSHQAAYTYGSRRASRQAARTYGSAQYVPIRRRVPPMDRAQYVPSRRRVPPIAGARCFIRRYVPPMDRTDMSPSSDAYLWIAHSISHQAARTHLWIALI
ncbi:hypothetical protein AVEN_176773-1 [Araneus ventricosus]|uniref:Uncharacterized protein n=1 Tax=Araneus ventricosus TaxID=182803 RepID=A0A4Y2TT28_ARAVE|nr:hypothetical protein AVEN_176773-1 [Araneus ventricosus]